MYGELKIIRKVNQLAKYSTNRKKNSIHNLGKVLFKEG